MLCIFDAIRFGKSFALRILILFVLPITIKSNLFAQEVYYSEINKKERANLDFQIIGKTSEHILIYKKAEGDHIIAFYDQKMVFLRSISMDFIPEKTISIDFIKYADTVAVVYAYVKNQHVFCYAAMLKASSNAFSNPVLIDESTVGLFADRDIYHVTASENKENILVYKKSVHNDEVTFNLQVFTKKFLLSDTLLVIREHNPLKEFFTDLIIDNNGTVAFTLENRKRAIDNFDSLTLFVHKKGEQGIKDFPLYLSEHYIEKVLLKADNINKNIILNAYYNTTKRGKVEGLFSAVFSLKDERFQSAFNILPKSFYSTISSSGGRGEIDNMDPKQILVKRNGEFVLIAEDSYTETFYNNSWNRNFSPVFSGANDFYFNNINGTGNTNNGAYNQRRYYSNNIVVAAVDSALSLKWTNSITKRQMDADADVYLSFAIINQGKEVQFLYIDRDSQKYILSRQSINFNGSIERYPTVKGNEPLVEFMPRNAKQVGAREIVVPFTYLNHLGFALMEF